jgi:hypothetical protein
MLLICSPHSWGVSGIETVQQSAGVKDNSGRKNLEESNADVITTNI